MKTKYITLAALLSTTFFACNPKPDTSSQNDTTEIAKEQIDTTLTNAPNSNNFAMMAAIGGMMEVESSAKMIKYTENPDIQDLADIMVRDHIAANAELKAIAKKEKITIPQTLPADKLKQLSTLDSFQEEERNRFYADLMVKEHNEAVALFTTASQNENNAALKAFAQKHLPILKAHQVHAINVKKMMDAIKNDKGDQPLKTSKDRKQ
jgi:putative membrane protein